MANEVVRENPLPVGRYWIVVTGKDVIARFDSWLQSNASLGVLKVEQTQTLSKSGVVRTPSDLLLILTPILGAVVASQRAKDPDQEFVTFRVLVPNAAQWSSEFGLPSKADDAVTTVQDVEQAPPPEKSGTEKIDDFLASAGSAVKIGIVVALGAVGIAIASRLKK